MSKHSNDDLLFSVKISDCEVDTFSSGGPGGQNVNRRSTGVRITHRPSGAIGKSTEERSQLQNKQAAFKRMANDPKMKFWINQQLASGAIITPEEQVLLDMKESNLFIEYAPFE